MAEYKFRKSDYISMVRQHKKKIAQMQQTIDQLNHDCELYKDYIRMMEDKKNTIVGKV